MIVTTPRSLTQQLIYKPEGYYIAHYQRLILHTVFQPIVTRNKTIMGVEALLRIYQTDGSSLRPDQFFHSNQYSLSDKMNVEYLSRRLHLHNFALSPYRSLKLFLNTLPVSPTNTCHHEQQERLDQHLAALNIKCEQIVMEFVEMESENDDRLQATTQQLSRQGYRIAIDDFGVEASTAQRVALLIPDIIKFDRQLLLDFEAGIRHPLLKALQLARQIGAVTIAEGIETDSQFEAMKALNMDGYQGYYLGTPEPAGHHLPQVVGQ